MKSLLILALAVLLVDQSNGILNHLRNLYKDTSKVWKPAANAKLEDALILTPYLQKGQIEEAQQAALVQNSIFFDVVSYAGYFTVDEAFDSNIWFWYFPSADNVAEDPVVLWLNGGPGASSLNGLFDENGPFYVDADGSVTLREYSWHRNNSVIFLDQPVGTGFSFTNGGLAENETKVGEDVFSALTQFFQLFPDLQTNDFFISGESYAGKFLPAIGHTILHKNPTAELKINLQGVMIGDGWTDPINQLNYGPYLYNFGLVSKEIRQEIDEHRDKAIAAIQTGDFSEAHIHCGAQLDLMMVESMVNPYNIMLEYDDTGFWVDFVNTEEIRNAIHVGSIEFGDKGVSTAMYNETLLSVANWVEENINNYRVMIFAGQLDMLCNYLLQVDYINKMNFNGSDEYQSAPRNSWFVDDELAGYVRIGGNLTELLVRNAGHMVPKDQPKWGYDMLQRFTRNQPFA